MCQILFVLQGFATVLHGEKTMSQGFIPMSRQILFVPQGFTTVLHGGKTMSQGFISSLA
ncbi:hypothetical protein [uncultured Microscilla sp.]|uniref:hypothetical protein n=1 Tax=uncultured Microscilla sp. TaxID=432653 RepID=UPI00262D698E|nr:hypothetical protein [uncultured Microscilla sp.]